MEDLLTIDPKMASSTAKNIAAVVGRFGRRLLGFIRQRVGNEADAEDILQDVWYQLAGEEEPIEQVGSWLFRVARNKIIDRYRKRRPESFDPMAEDQDDAADFSSLLADDGENPETAELRGLFWKTLQSALDELPEAQRMVFIWNELEGIPFKEIAAMTGDPVNTLLSRKRYAVLYLRQRMFNLYQEIMQH